MSSSATAMPRALALTLDLDGPSEYARLFQLSVARAEANVDLVMYGAPLGRFVQLCAHLGGPATLFAVGRDLDGGGAAALRPLVGEGFEVACHSFSHDYQLSRRAPAVIEEEVTRAKDAIGRSLGLVPAGFRAPGYHQSPALLDALEREGFAYDSSVMASPPYYAAKAAVLSWYRLSGRRSGSLLGSPALAFAPRQPYHPAQNPYRPGQRRILELPISVATPLRLPVTGASLMLAPAAMRSLLGRALDREPLVVLNFHAMDFVDAARDGLAQELASHQPELRIGIEDRLERVRSLLEELTRSRPLSTCGATAQALAGATAG